LNKIDTPLVSVVIPTYNHGDYLEKAISSVLSQNYNNYEIIVIDNHSSDNSNEIISNFKDNRIQYLKIHNNGVIAKSRNSGVKVAKGEWIAFLDSDDWWTYDKLKTCMYYADKNVDLIYHDLKIVSTNSRLLGRKKNKTRQLKKPILYDLLVNGNPISNSSVIVRKKMLEKIGLIDERNELVAAEDYNTWLRISNLTDKFLYLPKRLGYYLIHDQSISKKDMSLPYRKATCEFLKFINNNQKIKLESTIRYLSGRYNYLNHNNHKAKKDLLFTLRNGFFFFKMKALFMILMLTLKN
jgi:glycosyltransferase involved in cell wall biosynthesis